jgi:hypothetical protein
MVAAVTYGDIVGILWNLAFAFCMIIFVWRWTRKW